MPAKAAPRKKPVTTTKHVGPGQADSRRQNRDNRARVQRNAERVEAINDKHSEPTRTDLVAEAQQRGIKGASAMRKDALVKAIAQADKATTPPVPELGKSRGVIDARAMDEQRALKQWEKGGRKGPRPATPNYDVIQEAANGGPSVKQVAAKNGGSTRKRSGSGTPRTPRSDRGAAAMAEKQRLNNKRGKGKAITDEELVQHFVKVLRKHPDATAHDEVPYAYWIEKFATTRTKARKAFEDAQRIVKKEAKS